MPTKYQIFALLAVTALVQDVALFQLLRKHHHLSQAFLSVYEQNTSLEEQMAYLVHMLNENDVELDEFDLIALPSVTLQS